LIGLFTSFQVNLYKPIFRRNQKRLMHYCYQRWIISSDNTVKIVQSGWAILWNVGNWIALCRIMFITLKHPSSISFVLYHPRAKAAYTRVTSGCVQNAYIYTKIGMHPAICGCIYVARSLRFWTLSTATLAGKTS